MIHALYKLKVFFKSLFVYPELVTSNLSYDQYWQEKKKGALGIPNSFQVTRGRWISERLNPGASVIDIGCGDGSVLFAIQKYKDIEAYGADLSQFILDFLNTRGIKGIFIDLNNENNMDTLPNCDHALILEVLEHLSKPEEYLFKILKKVNKSVFISIPNTGYIQHRLRLLFGKFPLQWRTHPSEHLRFWTVDDFEWWIGSIGLKSKTEFHCYAGVPFLNKLFPKLFAQGIIAEIKK